MHLMRNSEVNAAHRLPPAAVPPVVSLVTGLPPDRCRKVRADVVKHCLHKSGNALQRLLKYENQSKPSSSRHIVY